MRLRTRGPAVERRSADRSVSDSGRRLRTANRTTNDILATGVGSRREVGANHDQSDPRPAPVPLAILAARHSGLDDRPVQRLARCDAGELPYDGLAAQQVHVSDDGDVIVPPDSTGFFASADRIADSERDLAASRSGVTLRKGPALALRPDADGGAVTILHRAELAPNTAEDNSPHLAPNPPGSGFSLPNSCRMAARTAMSGNPMDTSYAVFNKPDAEGSYRSRDHAADESDKEWAMRFARDMRYTFRKQLIALSAEDDLVAADRAARAKDAALGAANRGDAAVDDEPTAPTDWDTYLGEVYFRLPPAEKSEFDQLAGINAHAAPEVGHGYSAMYDFDLASSGTQVSNIDERRDTEAQIRDERAGGVEQGQSATTHKTKSHWALVVMKSGADRITLESTRSAEYSSLVPTARWKVQMYGTETDTFHEKWGFTPGKYTTMVVGSDRGSGGDAEPTPAPIVVAGDPALANMALIGQIQAELQHWQPKPMMGNSPSLTVMRGLSERLGRHEFAYLRHANWAQWVAANVTAPGALMIADDF